MFIYVMDIKSKETLEELGYMLLKDNGKSDSGTVWVFANKEEQQFEDVNVPCIVSDILTF